VYLYNKQCCVLLLNRNETAFPVPVAIVVASFKDLIRNDLKKKGTPHITSGGVQR
jgi:6,7-dimethyl-8-ribityllumazine synthase